MDRPRTQDKDTTIKDKGQVVDLTDDTADVEDEAQELLPDLEAAEEELVGGRDERGKGR